MDSHNSHIIVNFITYCMKHAIKLFILFLHTLHFFQSFNINMFMLLKHTLIKKIDIIFRHNLGHISQMN